MKKCHNDIIRSMLLERAKFLSTIGNPTKYLVNQLLATKLVYQGGINNDHAHKPHIQGNL
jgi:hypothetical protein